MSEYILYIEYELIIFHLKIRIVKALIPKNKVLPWFLLLRLGLKNNVFLFHKIQSITSYALIIFRLKDFFGKHFKKGNNSKHKFLKNY